MTDSSSDVVPYNAVSAGRGSDWRIATLAALMPLGLGLSVLLGFAWLAVFGIIIAVAGSIWWAVWWHRKHKGFFPRDVEGGPFIFTAALVVVLLLISLAIV